MSHFPTTVAHILSQETRRVTVILPYLVDAEMNHIVLDDIHPEFITAAVALEVAKLEVHGSDLGYGFLDFDVLNHIDQTIMLVQPTRSLNMYQLCNGIFDDDCYYERCLLEDLHISGANIIYISEENDAAYLEEPLSWDFAVIYNQETQQAVWCENTNSAGRVTRISLDKELDVYFAQKLLPYIVDTHLAKELRLPTSL